MWQSYGPGDGKNMVDDLCGPIIITKVLVRLKRGTEELEKVSEHKYILKW